MSIQNSEHDQLDRMIGECIMQDAALTSTQLGEKVGLSSSAANERLRRLKLFNLLPSPIPRTLPTNVPLDCFFPKKRGK